MAGRGSDDAASRDDGSDPSASAGETGDSNRRPWTIVVFATMAVFGTAMMVRGPVVPELGATFGAPEWQLGLVAPAATAGFLLAVSAVGFGAGHVSPRRLILVGLLVNAATMVALGAAPTLWLFLVAVAVQGATIGGVRGINRPTLSHFYPTARGRVYSYYDMTWGAGAALGPLLVIAVLAVGSWRHVFWLLAGVMLLLAARVSRLATPSVETAEDPVSRGDVLALLRRPEVLAMGLVIFFVAGLEGGMFLWLPTYASGELSGPLAGLALTLFVGAYVPGRFVCGRLADRVGHLPLLAAVLLALLPVFGWTFALAEGRWLLPGILGVGLLTSGAYPLLTAYATDAAPAYSGPVTAVAAVTASLGVGVVPTLMGVAISGADAGTAMQLLAIPLVVSVLLVVLAGLAERWRPALGGEEQSAD